MKLKKARISYIGKADAHLITLPNKISGNINVAKIFAEAINRVRLETPCVQFDIIPLSYSKKGDEQILNSILAISKEVEEGELVDGYNEIIRNI